MKNILTVDIVFPVYYDNINTLEDSTAKVLMYIKNIKKTFIFNIIISINGPHAHEITKKAKLISQNYKSVKIIYTKNQGKGHGVLNAWKNSSADILTYMDIDLSTSLKSFDHLLDEIRKGADIAIGSRYLVKSKIKRSFKRYFLSKIYHIFLINAFLRLPIKDVQCGFKAITNTAFKKLSTNISDHVFFFEAEMLYLAYALKMKIVEIPVNWTECQVTGVKLFKTSVSFILNVFRLKLRNIFNKK